MNNQKLISLLAVVLLIPGFFIGAFAQKSVDLKYKLNKGDIFSYNMNTDMDVVFETNGMTMALDNIILFETTANILFASDDSVTIDTQVKRIQSTQKMFGMEVKYDSDDPASAQNPMAAQIAAAFGAVIGKSYAVVMDVKGNILRTDMSQMTEDSDFADNLNSGTQYALYPDHKVRIGDTWEQDIKPLEASDMKVYAKYTLLKLSGSEAVLGFDGTISANSINEQDIKMNGTQKGEMRVDVKTGWVIESKIDQDIEMDIDQGGQKFPATVTGTITIVSNKLN